MQKYHISLTREDHQILKKYMGNRLHSPQSIKRAKILEDIDEIDGKRQYTTKEISKRHNTSEATISEVCRRYESGGIHGVVGRKKRSTPPVAPKVTGEVEAHIIATCCSTPPEGKAAWTMQMIAEKIVVDGIVDSISDETVRLVLKKRNSSHI
jgi:transposase